jgi:hypothetical protein
MPSFTRLIANKRVSASFSAFFGLLTVGGLSVAHLASSQAPPLRADVAISWEEQERLGSVSGTTAHVPIPKEVRGIYWTALTAGSAKAVDRLTGYISANKLNTAVIDLKMDDGEIAFATKDPMLVPYAETHPAIHDLEALLSRLQQQNVYRIARIAVMRDGAMASVHPDIALLGKGKTYWRDSIGSVWVDPASPLVTETAIHLAREAYARGFDEVQFDYVRYPSDGKTSSISYPVSTSSEMHLPAMQTFFKTVGSALEEDGIPHSFDVFGMTFWSTSDFNIGQRLNDVYAYADYVSPMVYPSHYPAGFKGYKNPADFPYEIVKRSLDQGVETLKIGFALLKPEEARPKFRPWIQDFNIGAKYDAAHVEAQVKAARDAGASGWLVWNARNVYTPACYVSSTCSR